MFSISEGVRPEVDDLSESIFFSISEGSSRSIACSMMVMVCKNGQQKDEGAKESKGAEIKEKIEYDLRGTRATLVVDLPGSGLASR